MAFSQKTGGFAANTSTGNQSVTGIGFQPKAIIFYASNITAIGSLAGLSASYGVALSSSDRFAAGYSSLDNQAASNSDLRLDNTKCVTLVNTTPAIIFDADFVSMDADGFTINITTTDASARIISYIAFGGSDLTNVDLNYFQSSAGIGSQAVTGVGFQPDALILLPSLNTAAPPVMAGAAFGLNIGFATPNNQGQSNSVIGSGANPQTGYRRQTTTLSVNNGTSIGTIVNEGAVTSFDSDGYTINWTVAAQRFVCILALKGGTYKVGTITQPAVTGSQAITGVGFQPRSLMTISVNAAASTTYDKANSNLSLGSGNSSSSRRSFWIGNKDAVSPTEIDMNLDDTKLIKLMTSGTPTVNAAADLTSMDADGFTLDWTTADATARQIIYMAMGDTIPVSGNSSHTGSPLRNKANLLNLLRI